MTTTADLNRQDRLATQYGVQETGMPVGHEYHQQVEAVDYSLAQVAAEGGRITRVRLLSERGRCDISYIHATIPARACAAHRAVDGGPSSACGAEDGCRPERVVRVRVDCPSGGIGLWLREVKGEFIAWGREQGVFAKGIGLLDEGNWSVLRG